MKVVYLNVEDCKGPEEIDIEPELDEFYRLIKCDAIDIVRRKIGGRYFRIVCDDEGLFKENVKISACLSIFHPMMVGNLLIFGMEDKHGELTGLTPSDVLHIKHYCFSSRVFGHPVLHCVDV